MVAIVWLWLWLWLCAFVCVIQGEDPYIRFTWNITYGTISPLGVPQQGILINGQFPGPNINSTTNNNVVVNVFNGIDEPFLIHWFGIQQRKNSWQDGLPGTNCPIMPGTNFTYHFQVKDQIGSYMYYPSTALHRAAGGFGGLRINSRPLIPVPYDPPEDDFTVMICDWHTKSHTVLKKQLDSGRALGRPDGVLINGNNFKEGGKEDPLFTMKSGKTYRYRICNVGLKTSMNICIQNHTLTLVEMEGSHVVQNEYESLDVHVGQCFTCLVAANKDPMDYKMVVSTRLMKEFLSTAATIRYQGSKGAFKGPLPKAPVGWAWSLNQFRSFRWNLTASAARPNPQGSYHYGQINITRTLKLVTTSGRVDGKLRYAINGISHKDADTPLKLAEYYGAADKVFKYDTMKDEPAADVGNTIPSVISSVLNQTYRNFVEIVFENNDKSLQSFHLDGYSFFAVAVEPGKWNAEKRKDYNLLDAVSRHTVQVFPKCWAAIMLTFDNAGMWNLRSEITERRYLGQQFYISVLSPSRNLKDEYNMPDNIPLCGIIKDMPLPKPYSL